MLRNIIFLVICVLMPHQARSAVFAESEILSGIPSLRVEVTDGVNGSCLQNVDAIKVGITANFSRSKIIVDNTSDVAFHMDFNGLEVTHSDGKVGCVASANLWLRNSVREGGLYVMAFNGATVVGSDALDDQLVRVSQAFADEVITAILQARMKANAQP